LDLKQTKMNKRGFASDNNSGIHPNILKAINEANTGHVKGYGDDLYTQQAINKFKALFHENIDVYFVFNGTAANVLSLTAATNSFNSIICSEHAHINVDECGAPEKFSGCKLIPIPTTDGKLSVDLIKPHIKNIGDQHHSQPSIVTITQPTELGTLYQPHEISEIAAYCHKNNMLLHIDGARIANAVAALNMPIAEFTSKIGADIISFGGTKNGMMMGEAIVFLKPGISNNFKFIRKQGMHLFSKMRFISAQFSAYLENDLWIKNAQHANSMAQILNSEIRKIPQISISQKVEANGVFAVVPEYLINELQKHFFFYTWNEAVHEVRWMCSFDTTEDDIHTFIACIKKLISK
jgi:threonine aldolase